MAQSGVVEDTSAWPEFRGPGQGAPKAPGVPIYLLAPIVIFAVWCLAVLDTGHHRRLA